MKKKRKAKKKTSAASGGHHTNVNVNVEVTPEKSGGGFPMASAMLNAADMDMMRLKNM